MKARAAQVQDDALAEPPSLGAASPEIPNAVTEHRSNRPPGGEPNGGELAEELQMALDAQRAGQAVLDGRLRQQATIVRLGLEALASRDLNGTLELLVREAAAGLGVEFCSVLEVDGDGTGFRLRADFGCSDPKIGQHGLWALGEGQARYTLHMAAPVVTEDLRAETRFRVPDVGLQQGAVSGLSVVLHGKQKAWGVVGAFAKTRRAFTEDETNFLQAVANLMALAIERDRVEAALRQRNRQQEAIVRLGMEAIASRELANTLDLLVRDVAATIRADMCSVLEMNDDRKQFEMRASVGWPAASEGGAASSALQDSQAHYTISSGAPVVSPDLRRESRFTVQPVVLAQSAVSCVSVALQGKSRCWGVLSAYSKTPRTFAGDDVTFLQAVANLMGLAIERDRVEAALRNRNRQQAAVAALGRRALVGPHMDDLFADTAREIAATLQVDLCEILQRNPDGRTLLLRAGVGWQPGMVGTARVSSALSSQAGFAMSAEAPVVVADLPSETRFEPSPLLRDHGVASGIMVLIPTRNASFGVLGAHSRKPRAFSQDDSNFLQAIANLLGGAIERHRVEGELRRHRDNLEDLVDERTAALAASNRELEAFSYTISHDLRAPLRSINGLSKIVQRKYGAALPEDARVMLGQMSDETVRMGRLIESILALSRLGSVELAPVTVDITAAATAILERLQGAEPARKVTWSVEPGLTALADEGLLRLVIENLVGNAWKFTARRDNASITVAGEIGGFRVQDDGAGFDMAHSRELFQPFHRLHAAEDFEGTGIGLATVGRIVARHGGRVWAEAAPDKGATFHVALAREPAPALPALLGTHALWQPRIP